MTTAPRTGTPDGTPDTAAAGGPLLDLASRALGASVVHATDDFFAGVEHLLSPAPAVHDPAAYDLRGKVYDGWETRRRRPAEPGGDLGHDSAVIRLGAAGVVRQVVVDTAFFRGNYPPQVAVDGACLRGYPSAQEVLAASWRPLVPPSGAKGDTANAYDVDDPFAVTHVRLRIIPDGGVARLRVLGTAVPDPALLTGTVDTAAAVHGGAVVACSNLFYAAPDQLLLPGRARTTGEGWENARRRDGGHDWLVVRLAAATAVRRLEVDTGCFVGNAPGWVAVDGRLGAGAWVRLLPRTPVLPDAVQVFALDAGDPGTVGAATGPRVVDEVRLEVHPDGGLSRFRVHGELSRSGSEALHVRRLDTWSADDVAAELLACLASPSWGASVVAGRPHGTATAWLAAADRAYAALGDDEVARALAAHPRIGQAPPGAGREAGLSRGEQAAVTAAGDAVKAEIAAGNAAYEARFGRVFLIRAAGRSPAQILDALRRRLAQDDAAELAEAREQLRQITLLRLAGLLGAEPPAFGEGGEAA